MFYSSFISYLECCWQTSKAENYLHFNYLFGPIVYFQEIHGDFAAVSYCLMIFCYLHLLYFFSSKTSTCLEVGSIFKYLPSYNE